MKTRTNTRTMKMVQLSLFIAIIILMAFTPIGYIKTPGLEITLIVVPVTVGAIVFGPVGGAILGGVFGLTSFIQCFGMSPFGAVLLGINPVGTFILCFVPRVLMGWLSGLIFKALGRNTKMRLASHVITNLAGPLLNTILFMSTLVLFFYRTDYIQEIATGMGSTNILAFIVAFVGINGLVEAAACFVLGTAVSRTLEVFIRSAN